jgi:hypothetical protein
MTRVSGGTIIVQGARVHNSSRLSQSGQCIAIGGQRPWVSDIDFAPAHDIVGAGLRPAPVRLAHGPRV